MFFLRKIRPSDLEQRAGRTIRQGNLNDTVHMYRYVTKDTFDAYLYQLVENKQKFISQIMTSKSPVRSAEDIDETAVRPDRACREIEVRYYSTRQRGKQPA